MADQARDPFPAEEAESDLEDGPEAAPARGGCGRAGCGFLIGVLGSALITVLVIATLLTRGHLLTFAERLLAGSTASPTPIAPADLARAASAVGPATASRGQVAAATGAPQPTATNTFIPVPTAVPTRTPTPTPTATPTPIIALRQVNELGRYESMQFVVQTVVDLAREPSNIWERICGSDQLLLVAGGEVIAGFDLSKVGPGDLQVSGKSLKLALPPPEVFSYFVREDQTYVYQRNTGLLCRPDPSLETQARRQAEQRLLDYAMAQGILQRSEKAGLTQLQAFFRDLGFEQVELVVKPAASSGD
jgi:hypothetical protein